jgi:peptidoglycan hydrolase-like protein with peptidoglycan-binding domain
MRIATLMLTVLLLAGCTGKSPEERARAELEKMKESVPDVEAKALAQKAGPEEVKQAQAALTALHEYQGEVNGQLDAVTVNSIQAFQTSHGFEADGILTEKVQRALQDAAGKAKAQS